MKRRLLSVIIALLIISQLSIIGVMQWQHQNPCHADMVFKDISPQFTDYLLVDPITGVQTSLDRTPSLDLMTSADGRYQYNVEGDTVIVRDLIQETERVLYRGTTITNLRWAYDNQALLISAYDASIGQTTITSYDLLTDRIRFEYRNEPSIRWRQSNPLNPRYLYAPFILGGEELRNGVIFFDMITGDTRQYESPTSFPYIWSASERWVASSHRVVISIIDPTTGNLHPNFTEPIIGQEFQWQGDEALWFVRVRNESGFTTWRANLSDGTVTAMIPNARLHTISNDGLWAYVLDETNNHMTLIDISTKDRYPLPIMQSDQSTIHFSPTGRCAVIWVKNLQADNSTLILFDLSTGAIWSQQQITDTYQQFEWLARDR